MSSFVTMRCHLLELKKNKRATLYSSWLKMFFHWNFSAVDLTPFTSLVFPANILVEKWVPLRRNSKRYDYLSLSAWWDRMLNEEFNRWKVRYEGSCVTATYSCFSNLFPCSTGLNITRVIKKNLFSSAML